MTSVIQIDNVSKRYQLGEYQQSYQMLRESLTDLFRRRETKPFWALKDISFNVEQGEVIGVIGRNGAGKSTLLKILSHITLPTAGTVQLRGRVASLLEVGTGFHPELTGRENVFLNGAILGMGQGEIRRKFDEIVAFAEIDKFLDTPVKRYSSGMYVRLAFAVAAHLEPEILLVDEVLAVGDTEFQKKCLGKIEDVATQHGRTIVFVSHNMGAIRNLCKRVVFLEQGQVKAIGPTDKIVEQYLKSSVTSGITLADRTDRQGNGLVRVQELTITNQDGSEVIKSFDRLTIDLRLKADQSVKNIELKIAFLDVLGQPLFRVDSDKLSTADLSAGHLRFETNEIPLAPITCYVNIGVLAGGELADYVQNAMSFDLTPTTRPGVRAYPNDMAVLLVGSRLK